MRALWPPETAQQAFVQHLQRSFDYTQLGAIEVRLLGVCACLCAD